MTPRSTRWLAPLSNMALPALVITVFGRTWTLPLLLFVALAGWFAFCEASALTDADSHDLGPRERIMSAALLAWLLASPLDSTQPLWAGIIVALAGIELRRRAILELGRGFATTLRPRAGLVTSGPYSWVRHPSELGILLYTLGASLTLGSVVASVLWVVLCALVWWRSRYEDRELVRSFGDAYERYASR